MGARQIPNRALDAEDVALSARHSLCRGATVGRFAGLERSDLWALLVGITAHEAQRSLRRALSKKRGGGQVRGESLLGEVRGESLLGEVGFRKHLSQEPTPEFVGEMADRTAFLLAELPSEDVREVARSRLESYTNVEIAERLSMAHRTVDRRLALVRQLWERHFEGGSREE